MHDTQLKCATLSCPKARGNDGFKNWCCHGCDDASCADRCHNHRNKCNVAIYGDGVIVEPRWRPWSQQETATLAALYDTATDNELVVAIPSRTIKAIHQKALYMGLKLGGRNE